MNKKNCSPSEMKRKMKDKGKDSKKGFKPFKTNKGK